MLVWISPARVRRMSFWQQKVWKRERGNEMWLRTLHRGPVPCDLLGLAKHECFTPWEARCPNSAIAYIWHSSHISVFQAQLLHSTFAFWLDLALVKSFWGPLCKKNKWWFSLDGEEREYKDDTVPVSDLRLNWVMPKDWVIEPALLKATPNVQTD